MSIELLTTVSFELWLEQRIEDNNPALMDCVIYEALDRRLGNAMDFLTYVCLTENPQYLGHTFTHRTPIQEDARCNSFGEVKT